MTPAGGEEDQGGEGHLDGGSVLDALDVPIAVLDPAGVITTVNAAWRAAAQRGHAPLTAVGPGVSYLEVCDRARGPYSLEATLVGDGVRSVLRGEADRFAAEYPCPDDEGPRWWTVHVTPLRDAAGGVVVAHFDVTSVRLPTRGAVLDVHRVPQPRATLDGAIVLDAAGRILRSAGAAPTTSLAGEPFRPGAHALADVVHPADAERAATALADAVARPGQAAHVRLRVGHRSTTWRLLDMTLVGEVRPSGAVVVRTAWIDVTEDRRVALEERAAELMARLPAAVVVLDDAGLVTLWNDRAEQLYRCTAAEVLGRDLVDVGFGPFDPAREEEVAAALGAGRRWDGDFDVHLPDGSSVPAYLSFVPLRLEEVDFSGTLVTSVDVSEHRALEYRLEHLALHDHLTGLPNRVLLMDRLNTALSRARRDQARAAVLFVDLDGFKAVNDRLGHAAGDEVLRAVARLLEGVIRDGDTVARIAGDEFVVCADLIDSPQVAIELAERMVAAISASFGTSEQHITLSASIGIALSHRSADADTLLRDADTAMYRAKRNGKGRVELFDEQLRRQVQVRRELEASLGQAVRDHELLVHFQPIVELATGVVAGAEALLRWDHPALGLVGPDRFIAAADEGGLAQAVGAQALAAACAAAARWRALRPGRPPTVSVDLSARHLAERSLLAQLAAALGAHDLDPRLLTVEIAETTVMADFEAALEVTAQLAALGVRIAVDDVGSGYSSVSHLRRLPIEVLKIDGALVRGLGASEEDRVIVSAVVNLAAVRGLEIVAQGVEHPDQLRLLAELGCQQAQGHLLGHPMEEEALVARLTGPSVASPRG